MSPRTGTGLRYAVDGRPPHWLAALLGMQVVILILAGITITPLIVLRAAATDLQYADWVVFAALAVSGVTTVLQAWPIGRFGAGYVLFMGTSSAFLAVGISAIEAGGLALMATLAIASSLFQFAFASRLAQLRRIVTPTVGGIVIMLIAVNVFPIAFKMLGAVPPTVDRLSSAAPVTAIVTLTAILGVSLFASGAARLWGPILGVIAGSIVAAFYGLIDLSGVARAAWIGLPGSGWPGLDLSFGWSFWALLPAFIIVTLVGAIETYGDGIAIQRVSVESEEPVDFRAVQGAVNADGLGNLLSGLMGTLPNTTYSTSISVVDITRVAARVVGIYGGVFLLLLAFSPKLSSLLQAIPGPVVGAYIIVLLVLLFGHGLRLVAENGISYEESFVVGLAFWLGTGFQSRAIFGEHMPDWLHGILANGMTSGTLVALLLTSLLALRRGQRHRVSLRPDPRAIPQLHAFIAQIAERLGWDRSAVDRLQLAAEEGFLLLAGPMRGEAALPLREIRLEAREVDGNVALEFLAGSHPENLERRIRSVSLAGPPEEDDIALRLLRHLALEVQHQQFHEGDYLLLTVDSRPLGMAAPATPDMAAI